MKDLKDTIELMNSKDYKDRFKAEYIQLKIRLERLGNLLIAYYQDTLEFEPTCPVLLLADQYECMNTYKNILEERARIEGIDLSD